MDEVLSLVPALGRLWGLFSPIPTSAVRLGAAQHSCPACLSVPGLGQDVSGLWCGGPGSGC